MCRVRSFILKNPSCLMARDDIEATPLHYAAKHGHLEIVFMIVNEGTDEGKISLWVVKVRICVIAIT